jgi:hypothetical protein
MLGVARNDAHLSVLHDRLIDFMLEESITNQCCPYFISHHRLREQLGFATSAAEDSRPTADSEAVIDVDRDDAAPAGSEAPTAIEADAADPSRREQGSPAAGQPAAAQGRRRRKASTGEEAPEADEGEAAAGEGEGVAAASEDDPDNLFATPRKRAGAIGQATGR